MSLKDAIVEPGMEVSIFEGHIKAVTAIIYEPETNTVITGSADGVDDVVVVIDILCRWYPTIRSPKKDNKLRIGAKNTHHPSSPKSQNSENRRKKYPPSVVPKKAKI